MKKMADQSPSVPQRKPRADSQEPGSRWLVLCVFLWFGVLAVSSQFAVLNLDEPWYLAASSLIGRGSLPYRDFFFTQMPLLPYVYAVVVHFVGASLAGGRLFSIMLSTLAVASSLSITRAIAGTRGAILLFLLLLTTPGVLAFLAVVKTYSLVASLSLLSLMLVFHPGSRSTGWGAWLSAVLAGLAAAARISFLPVTVFVWLYWVWRRRFWSAALGALAVLAFAAPVLLNSGGNFLYDAFEFHQYISFSAFAVPGIPSKIVLLLAIAVGFAPGFVMAVFLLVLSLRSPGVRWKLTAWWRERPDTNLLLVATAAGLAAVHFVLPADHWEYQVPGSLVLYILLAAAISSVTDLRRPANLALLVACAAAATLPAWLYWSALMWQPTNTLQQARLESQAIAAQADPGDAVLGVFSHLALADGLRVFPGNEMGQFSVSDELGASQAGPRHLLTTADVTAALTNCSPAFVVADTRENPFSISAPSTQPIAASVEQEWRALLHSSFQVIYQDGLVIIFRRIPERCPAK